MPQSELKTLLKSSEPFKLLNSSELDTVIKNSTHINYKKGETVCKQGGFFNHMIFITDGLAKAYLEGPNDKNLITELNTPGEFVGLSSLFDATTYHVSVSAINKSSVLFIEKTAFQNIVMNNTKFSNFLLREFAKNMRYSYNKISSLGNKQLHGRFADAILYLSKVVAKSNVIDLSITRREIGELAGISTESAIRLLSELSHDGILELQGKKIIILQEELLMKLGEIG